MHALTCSQFRKNALSFHRRRHTMSTAPRVDYQTHPSQYKHWKLSFDGAIATLTADFDENGGLAPGYKLKLNSYDLGVDIELNDAINRIRFEHPEVRTVVVTSAKEKVFCSGANIFMLGVSSHGWKVNFCKFTNETRNGLEDSSQHSGLKFLAAVNGACAGGGYELALACDEIILVDDRSSAVSLPEVPLLGVLPGTGGLTRVTDKRHVRHDLADIFCTTTEGVRGQKAKDWRLVDDIAKPAVFAQKVRERAEQLAAQSDRPADGRGVELVALQRRVEADALHYDHVSVNIDRSKRTATFLVKAPTGDQPADVAGIEAAGAAWYPLALARQLEDAILSMRTNELDIGTWLITTQGDAAAVLAMDAVLSAHAGHWLVRETIGLYPMVTGQSRLGRRFYDEAAPMEAVRAAAGRALDADAAFALGLVTSNPDDIDWADEVRIAIEECVAMSPDALTGMEANLRFNGPENMFTRIFGRLTAWQNWIFQRPNAVGEYGALKVYGKGNKAAFDWNRV